MINIDLTELFALIQFGKKFIFAARLKLDAPNLAARPTLLERRSGFRKMMSAIVIALRRTTMAKAQLVELIMQLWSAVLFALN